MSADCWNPEQYERFRAEREQPFWDLLALVQVREPSRTVDLGCGTGELTGRLHRILRCQETVGVDSSAAMLARAHLMHEPGLRFIQADLREWMPDAAIDVVFSNAALQWVDDHPSLFARLHALLAPGGELAVQMPANHDHPSHTVAAEVALEEPFAMATGGYTRVSPVMAPEAYAELLHRLGFAGAQVRLQVYCHQFAAPSDVVEWVRGTLLTAYEQRMPEPMFDAFLLRYGERLLSVLGDGRPYLYAFKRLLLHATVPADPG